ncbi:MAG: hypothetical protein K6G81_09260, partial [Lachnospiraceae bacterium]|nr:hypothetical protein [Lachnospiraceae bacterium]
ADGMTTAAGTDSLAGNGGPGADRMAAGFDGAAGDNGATNAAGSAAAGSDGGNAGANAATGNDNPAPGQEPEPMARIYLGGVGTYINGIKELIENEFNGIEVVVLDKLPGINVAKDNKVAEEHSTELIACIGATFPTISFYAKSAREALSSTLILSVAGLVVVGIAAVVIILNGKSEYDKAVMRRDQLAAQRSALEAGGIEQLEQEYAAAQARFDSVAAADAGTFTFNERWNEIMGYLETESVSDIIISSVSSTVSDLTMNVTVSSKEEAAKVLLQFQQIPYFKSVSISAVNENSDAETEFKTVTFSLRCEYQLPPDPNAPADEEGQETPAE